MRHDVFNPGPRFARNDFQETWNRELAIDKAIRYFGKSRTAKSGVVEDTGMLATLASRKESPGRHVVPTR